jgi:hypothetical protein
MFLFHPCGPTVLQRILQAGGGTGGRTALLPMRTRKSLPGGDGQHPRFPVAVHTPALNRFICAQDESSPDTVPEGRLPGVESCEGRMESMTDQSLKVPVDDKRTEERERQAHIEDESIARACLFSFAASAAATLIICGAIRPPLSSDLWQRIHIRRVDSTATRDAKGASPTPGLSVS